MGLLRRLFGKSWQAYYQHKDTLVKERMREEVVRQYIKEVRAVDPGIGGEKLHVMYQRQFGVGYKYMVGRDKMEAIIARNNLYIRPRRKKPKTTDSHMDYLHILIS